MSKKFVYLFSEGDATMRELLGGKGANLAEMTKIGLPIPQGFIITTEACTQFYEDGRQINDAIVAEINENVIKMEKITGKKFGDHKDPLLVSIRSGSRASMPGMMDTILNLGLNEEVIAGMIKTIPIRSMNALFTTPTAASFRCSPTLLWEAARSISRLIDEMKEERASLTTSIHRSRFQSLQSSLKLSIRISAGTDFLSDPKVQLSRSRLFSVPDNPRANIYRRDNDIP